MSRLISELEEPRFRHGPRHSEPGTGRHARALLLRTMRENFHDRGRSSFPPMPLAARVVGGLTLLALVSVASGSRLHGGGTSRSTVALLAITLLAVAAVTAIGAAGLSLGGYTLLRETRFRAKFAVIAAGGGVAAALAAVVLYVGVPPDYPAEYVDTCFHGTIHTRRQTWAFNLHWGDRGYGGKLLDTGVPCRPPGGGGRAGNLDGGGGGRGKPRLFLAVVGGTLFVLLIGAAVLAVVMRRRRALGAAGTEPDVVLNALDESLDDLRRERDIRRAIIACYARMERAFERSGSARRPHEAPFEFLARVLARVAREPGRVLTELFERAKFSVDPMGQSEKDQAIAALEALRSEVLA